jgi:hypothetical protein
VQRSSYFLFYLTKYDYIIFINKHECNTSARQRISRDYVGVKI